MFQSRPCGICGTWFAPDPRVGERQRICSSPDCQRERHKRACAKWNSRERPELVSLRLRARVAKAVPKTRVKTSHAAKSLLLKSNPRDLIVGAAAIACESVQDEIRPQLIESLCIFAVLLTQTQDERLSEVANLYRKNGAYLGRRAQAQISLSGGAP